MKKLLITLIVLASMLTSFNMVYAHADEGGHVDLETATLTILEKYQVENVEDLDCETLTDEDFELLGDAWMEEMHPGEAHEIMDERMGGEGSEFLRDMHIRMGENHLGCGDYQGMMGMMGSRGRGMLGPDMMGGYGGYENMRSEGFASYKTYSIAKTILYIAVSAFLVSGTYYFVKKSKEVSEK